MKKVIFAIIIAVFMMAAAWEASADTISLVTGDGTFNVGTFDWLPGNALSDGGGGNVIVGGTPNLYYQAALGRIGDDGSPVAYYSTPNMSPAVPTIKDYEITIMVAALEQFVTVVPGFVSLQAINGGVNYIQVYYDTTPDANQLAGTGFDDGILIMSGTVLPYDILTGNGSSNFNVSTPLIAPLDNHPLGGAPGNDNYPGVKTLQGSGSTVLDANITYFNPLYVGPLDLLTLTILSNTSQVTPFVQEDPSAQFLNPLTNVPIIPSFWPLAGGGFLNGGPRPGIDCTVGVNCPAPGTYDFQFQADANSSVQTEVPEPSSLMLLGAGLLGIGGMGIFRRRNRR